MALILFFGLTSDTLAIVDPLSTPNNKYGIHTIDENDLEDAASLVNSTGGDWGYVTLVIREDERDTNRWQKAFDKMRKLHLIPIVRIASSQGERGWTQPKLSEIDSWVSFLNSLEWPVKNRYLTIGNEPNHASEWSGEISPEEYTDYLISFSRKLKGESDDFFVLPAGLDASAPNDGKHMSEDVFLQRMIEHNAEVINAIDGWASHSYPNPGFLGSVDDTGRGTVRNYVWELELLQSLGVEKDLPIFITETGWVHDEGNIQNPNLSAEEVSANLKQAFDKVWTDPRIVTVTPFILNYPGEPFGKFSWKNLNGEYYEFYYDISDQQKVEGKPILSNSKPRKFILNMIEIVYNINHNFWVS